MISGLFLAYLPVQTYLKHTARQTGCMACTSSGRNLSPGRRILFTFLTFLPAQCFFPTLLRTDADLSQKPDYLYLEIRQHFSGSMCGLCLCKQPFQSSECHCGRKTWTSRNRDLVSHQCRYFLQCNMSSVRCCRWYPASHAARTMIR